ncbi:hypothetical protein [Aquimarina agarilytica]|uniref:hypothetical protein n=1 Tax=Aquimarina agarilytica TaxID=1087449 RepID=UPI00028960CE|nr:hypothetical protein [Aquimarina agarilytica]
MKFKFSILHISLIVPISIFLGMIITQYKLFPYNQLRNINQNIKLKILKKNAYDVTDLHVPNLDSILSVTKDNYTEIRAELRKTIFGNKTSSYKIKKNIFDKDYNNLENLANIDKVYIEQSYHINSIAYIFYPKKSNGKSFIYHQGHRGNFLLGKKTIHFLVKQGFTVAALDLPLVGFNNTPSIYLKKFGNVVLNNHKFMEHLDDPISFFINPIINILDILESKGYNEINMIGISGGGWATTIAAAIDERIKNSFPVAGTYPMYIRFQDPYLNYGHFEGAHSALFKKVNYLDMYILSCLGENRKQYQILNLYDPKCCSGYMYKSYASFVEEKVKKLSPSSEFKVIIDSTHFEHKISEFSHQIIEKKLFKK